MTDATQAATPDNKTGTATTQTATGQQMQATQTGQQATTQQTTTQATTGTVLDDGGDGAGTQTQQNVGAWRDDWRVAMASGDEKLAKQLDRYASPEAVAKALREAQVKISSGQLKSALPKDATPDQVAAWRQENGIPETPDKYDLSLPNGLVVGESDKPLVDSFLKHAHGRNWTPDKVKEGLEWYYAHQDEQRQAVAERDSKWKAEAEDELRKEWGGEYRVNQRILKESLDAANLTDKLVGARDAEGRLLLADPQVIRWLVAEARDKNPVASVLPSGGGNSLDAAHTELQRLTKLMGDPKSEYWKGPMANKNQARFRELTDAVERMKGRAA